MVPTTNIRAALRLGSRLRSPGLFSRNRITQGLCEVCGVETEFTFATVVPDEMAETAEFTPRIRETWDKRESMYCAGCAKNFRARQMARALVQQYGGESCHSLADLMTTESFRSIRLLAIDEPLLGPMLKGHPNYHGSDYILSLMPAYGRPDNGLPWPDDYFDLVQTSDVLEHTPAYARAIEEIRRVLKPGGMWFACLPLLPERPTRTRAVLDEAGQIRHLLPPSHHCRDENESLVFVEFGGDFVKRIERAGFKVRVYCYSLLEFDYTSIFVGEKR